MKTSGALLLIMFTGLSACSNSKYIPPPPSNPATPQKLAGSSWVWDTALEKDPYIQFGQNGAYSGFSGCNQFDGKFQQTSNTVPGRIPLKIEQMIITEMACMEGSAEEGTFLDGLQNSRSYSMNWQDTLVLFDKSGSETLRLTRK